ncbi:MAG TPA: DUF5372 family protein [Bryobacteraceae bacterium]|nr:DUF5372 family protein [Bryobacteraceae bacterium]
MTHPFHPLFGRELEIFAPKEYVGERRLCYLDERQRVHEIPLDWTDLAPADPVLAIAAGKTLFRVADLLELAKLIELLKR